MSSERWSEIERVFVAALEKGPNSRATFLDESCKDDPELRREVDSLLASHNEATGLLETPAFAFAGGLFGSIADAEEGSRIGRYKLQRRIDEGGMGVVFLATRDDDQYQKQVAVKLIKQGFDTENIRRRFRHERQILANLDHPNIARLLDGGTSESGRPYLVMEFVEGEPITKYCEARQIPLTERLQLFLKVCAAVHFAHQNLVIHRDIKPGNVLVAETGEPKLLDFGIAKLLDADEQSTNEHTVTLMRVMTPDYASPEQVRGEQVTTATDVYSLGVLLYELLSGERPYKLKNRGAEELARIICDSEPEKPSTAIVKAGSGSQLKESSSEANSRSDIQNVYSAKLLRGDLDNIVLMAMRKEAERRYSSVAQFMDDVKRHLAGLPVIARQDTVRYRASKFVQRNKVGVAAACLVVVTLIGGIFATLWQSRIASRRAMEASTQRDQARIEREKAERVNEFLQAMLSSADPMKGGSNVKVSDLLIDAERRADVDLASEPEMQAAVRRTIGNTYVGLGLLSDGERSLRLALDAHQRLFGNEHQETARTLYDLGQLMRAKGDFDQAEKTFGEALAIQRRVAPQGDLNTATTLCFVGVLLFQRGKTDESEAPTREALTMTRRLVGENHTNVPISLNQLGLVEEYRGQLADAENYYRQAIQGFHALGTRSAPEALVKMNLATNLTNQKKYTEADDSFRDAIRTSTDLYGADHYNVAIVMTHYGRMWFLQGNYARSEQILNEALSIMRKSLPPGHPESAQTLVTLGIVLTRANKALQAESYLREALDIRLRVLPKGHWTTANVKSILGECLTVQDKFAQAEPLLKEGYEEIKAALGEKHPRTTEALTRLPQLYDAWNKPQFAAQYRALLNVR
jgi:eukaryotic-like serine/threonine-protein kinase